MEKTYRTVAGPGEDEIVINKSRFIGFAEPVRSEEQALEFIQSVREKHKTASHNVYAYILGETSQIQRFSDNGEPSGTAGIPVLEILKKEGLRDIVIVVTRYFGGIKLGGGGLVRAYSKSAKLAIESGIIVDMVQFNKIDIELNYSSYGRIESYLRDKGINPEEIAFEDNVLLQVFIREKKTHQFIDEIHEMTSGTAVITVSGEIFLPIRNGVRFQPDRGI
jgi:uncharacterized YigZ family protein